VVVAGGANGTGLGFATVDLFDPATSTFVAGPSLGLRRRQLVLSADPSSSTALVVGGATLSSGGTPNAASPTVLETITLSP
jgi:hypothetical protein